MTYFCVAVFYAVQNEVSYHLALFLLKGSDVPTCVVEHFWCTGAVLNGMPRVKYVHTLSVLTAIFQVNLGYPVFIEAKDDGSGGDNWSYKSCKAPVKSSPPTNQHPVFLQPGCLSCHPTNNVKTLKGKISHSMDLLTPSWPGVFQLCLWPLIAPGWGEGCHASHQPSDASTPWNMYTGNDKGRYGSFRLQNTCHTWALLRWWFTKRGYTKCTYLYAIGIKPRLTGRKSTSLTTESSPLLFQTMQITADKFPQNFHHLKQVLMNFLHVLPTYYTGP